MSSNGGLQKVSSGLNLWLELEDPKKMEELLGKLSNATDAIDAALTSLHYVHFARFLPTPSRSALQVITSFDGELDAYVLDFVLAIGDEFDMILGYVKNHPPLLVRDHPAKFLEFVRFWDLKFDGPGGNIDIDLYSAYRDRTVIDIVGSSGVAPAVKPETPVAVERSDVQATILRGASWKQACHFGLIIGLDVRARAFLAKLRDGSKDAPQISSDAPWPPEEGKPAYALTVGFTCAGLLAMGITHDDQEAFYRAHKAFFDGPDLYETAEKCGDVGDSLPDYWQLGGASPVDMVVSLYADDAKELADQAAALLKLIDDHQLSLANDPWPAAVLPDAQGRQLVHFGYVDGLSQPRLAIDGEPVDGAEMQPRANVGEFLLGEGYPNVFGGHGSLNLLSPALANNATFAVLRIMEQDVAGFEEMLTRESAAHGVSREWLAAKILGRWRDGTPTALSPDSATGEKEPSNQFDYLPSVDHPSTPDDSAGLRCPVGAHIRRMNPRSAIVAGKPHSRRLLRRGMPYGPAYDPVHPKDGQKRGLIGLFMCADVNRQFEFILRQWAQGDRATTGLVGQQDPIVGAQTMTGEYRIALEKAPEIVIKMPRLVKTVGSAYLFMPGLSGLDYLASGDGAKREVSRRSAFSSKTMWSRVSHRPLGAPPDPKTFDPRAKEFRDGPFPFYEWFRSNHPLVFLDKTQNTWVFSHDLVARIASDSSTYRKRRSTDDGAAGLLNMDHNHAACRAEVQPLFDQVLADIAPGIPGLVSKAYDEGCRNKGQKNAVDWVAAFAQPVAQAAFLELFGLTADQASDLKLVDKVQDILRIGTPVEDKLIESAIKFRLLLLGKDMKDARARAKPGRLFDLILQMKTLHDEKSNKPAYNLSGLAVEQLANAITMCMAGILPLQWFIAVATWRLLEDGGARLQEIKNDNTISDRQVVDELLRFDMSAPLSKRIVGEGGAEIDGVKLAKDDPVMLSFSSANHDPKVFTDPDQINFKRGNGGPGLAFGIGEHNCLGSGMVYAVMDAVIDTLRNANPVPQLEAGFKPVWGIPKERALFRAMTALRVHS